LTILQSSVLCNKKQNALSSTRLPKAIGLYIAIHCIALLGEPDFSQFTEGAN
jgi:hypothetical protein